MGDLLAWVTCQRVSRGWCTNVDKVGGVLTWMALVCSVSSFGDIGGNAKVVC